MPHTIGNIEIHMGPHQLGAPDNLLDAIVNFIDGAQKRLFIAVQELDCKPIAEAIIRARQRKVIVKVVLEADYLRAKSTRKDPFTPGGPHEINRELHDAILRANVKVNSDFNASIFHQKFIIRDSESVLTGSTNFTETGVAENLNHLVIIHDKEIAKHYNREYTEIQQGHFGKLNEGHDPHPAEINVSGIRVKTLFAPDHNPEMEIMKQIAKAKSRVDFAIFTFSRSSGIDDQLIFAKKSGLDIRGALFRMQANQDWSATQDLKKAGVELYNVPRLKNIEGPKPRKLHHKIMVIDKKIVIAGSFNYTGPANQLNDENIIILGDLDETNTESKKDQKKLANYVLKEIDRIIDKFGEKI